MSKLEFIDGSILLDGATVGYYYDGDQEPTIHFEDAFVKHIEKFGEFSTFTEIVLKP